MSVRQLAAYWRCSPKRVRDLVRHGIVKAFVVGRSVRVAPEAVREAEQMLAARPAGKRRKRRDADAIAPEVAKLLEGIV
jgi:hypothetical protein